MHCSHQGGNVDDKLSQYIKELCGWPLVLTDMHNIS